MQAYFVGVRNQLVIVVAVVLVVGTVADLLDSCLTEEPVLVLGVALGKADLLDWVAETLAELAPLVGMRVEVVGIAEELGLVVVLQ